MSLIRKSVALVLVLLAFLWVPGAIRRGYDSASLGMMNSLVTKALAQVGCVPNPNDAGPPFVNGCPISASGLNALANGVGIGLPQVATNAALKSLSASFSSVMRLGFSAAGDSPAVMYTLQGTACSKSAGAGDNGLQVTVAGGGKCWIANFAGIQPVPEIWGAVTGGVTDAAAPLQAALNSGVSPIYLSNATYRSSAQLTLTGGNPRLIGTTYNPNTAPPTGSTIQCDATLAGSCLKVGNNDNLPYTVEKLTISRGAGIIPGNGECLQVQGAQQVNIIDVYCYNHAQGFESDINGGNGIYVTFTRIGTCKISDSHFIVNSLPGVTVTDPIFGCNGNGAAFDVHGNNYVKITGNWDNTKGTIHFVNPQFNDGQLAAAVTCAVNFTGFTGSTNFVYDVSFIGGHSEVAENGICSDSTVKGLVYLVVSDTWWEGGWGGTNRLFNLDPATQIFFTAITSDHFTGWASAFLAPTNGFDDLKITGTSFATTPLSITSTAGSTINLTGNTYQGLALAGVFGASSHVSGVARPGGGTYPFTYTGPLEVDIPFVPLQELGVAGTNQLALQFGGAATGITYAGGTPEGQCQLQARIVSCNITFTLTNKGSATGTATLVGLPTTVSAGAGLFSCLGSNITNITNGTGPVLIAAAAGTSAAAIDQALTTGPTPAQLTNTQFANNSSLTCTFQYLF